MPVYKVEEYVAKAIESILNQTFKNFEFLIVDDGTPDKSGEICDNYAKKDSRIQVFHTENSGAPSARNFAIEKAKGKYLYFLDSDDWAEPTMLEDMLYLAERDNAQLVITGYFIDTYYNDSSFRTDHYKCQNATYKNSNDFRQNAHKLFDKNLLYTPWNKLYRTEYIMNNNIRYTKTFWDDFPFNLDVIRNIERVTVSDKQYYHFIRKRADSETAAYRPNMYDKREEEHRWLTQIYKDWDISTSETSEFLARRYIERFVGCIENLTNPKCTIPYKEKRTAVKNMLNNGIVKQAVKLAKPRSAYMKTMLLPIKLKSIPLTLLEGRVISFVKCRNTKVFSKLKAER